MNATLMIAVLILAAASTLPSPPSEKPGLAKLAWMAGTWKGDDQGVSMEESWTGPDGGMMLATHKDVKGGRVTDWEFLRIEEQADGIVYLASPKGAPVTPFRLVELKGERVVFANPEHDFPKRILYWRTSDGALHAGIDGGEGTKAMEWRWTRSR